MAKRLFLLLFSSFIGIFASPEILMASDDFTLVGLNNSGITETIPIVEEVATQEESVVEEPAYVAPVYVAPEPELVYVAPTNAIHIVGRNIEIVDVADTTVNAGDHVNKYGDRFFYGHNSAGVFGGLVNLSEGDMFSITYNGANTNYVVSKIIIFEKNQDNGRLQLNGSGSYMGKVADAKHDGVQYSISLMTCHGRSLGGGDATERLVIFANAI